MMPASDPFELAQQRIDQLCSMLIMMRAGDRQAFRDMDRAAQDAYIDVLTDVAYSISEAVEQIPEYDRQKAAAKAA